MKFLKVLFVLLVVFRFVSSAMAQVTLNLDDLQFSPGTEITNSYLPWTLTPGEPGTNQSWDFSSLSTAAFTSTETWDNPEGHYGAELFPTANRCNLGEIVEGAQMITYYLLTSTTITPVGVAYHTSSPDTTFEIPIESSGPTYTFPLSFGDEWDCTTRSDFFGNVSIDSSHYLVDSWGQVLTAYGETLECLRVFVQSFDLDEASDAFNYHYYWLAADFGTVCYVMSEDDPEETNFTGGTYTWISNIEDETGVHEIGYIQPSKISLNPAYPNPFNSQTRISYNLTDAGLTSVNVYDIQGRLVSTLVNGPVSSGNHEIYFNADNLPSGTYLVQLQSGNFQQTQKIQLIK